MVNAGKISLFDNIQQFIKPIELKDANGGVPEIKLWQLVSHNGGLNHGHGIFNNGYLPSTDDEIKQFYESAVIVPFTPGEVYHYSNHSFDVAELLIEKISGKSFQGYMNDNVFHPLGMYSTFAYPTLTNKNLVATYSTDLKKLTEDVMIFPAGGAGFWSSIEDLTQYALFHIGEKRNDKIINQENLKFMHNFRQGQADMFGIGWFNSDGNIYSDGNVTGGNAVISIDFKNNLAVICLLNRTSNDGIADQICGKINSVFVKSENNSFNEWRRIYGTKYNKRYDLLGKWEGQIKDPVTHKIFPFNLIFDDRGKIIINTENQVIEMNNPRYNLIQQLSANFKMKLPGIFNENVDCSMVLQRDHKKFRGYIAYQKFTKHSFYTMPLYVEIEKKED